MSTEIATSDFIPFARPSISDGEIRQVVRTLRSGWLTSGPQTRQFETDFAAFVDPSEPPHAIAINSATAGLHLALEALGIKRGDKVITSPFTFTASAEVMRYLGAHPLFVDIEPRTMNIDVDRIEAAILANPEVRAIMPVHFAGQACDMDAIMQIARRHDLAVIEDAAHALPTTYKDRLIGTIGDVTVYSFYVTKTLATGEGGMAVTNRDDLAKRMRIMRLHGISHDVFERHRATTPSWYYEVVAPGFKYNMTDLAAAIGIPQLGKAYEFQEKRAAIAARYDDAFADLPVALPYVVRPDDMHSWHLYVLQLDHEKLDINRDRFIELMAQERIGTSVHFIPLHLHPYWRDTYQLAPEDFPVAKGVFDRCVSLPIYPGLRDDEITRIVTTVRKILTNAAT